MSTNAKSLNAHNLQFVAVFTIFIVGDNRTFQIISVWFILHLKLLLLLPDTLTVTVRQLCFNCVLLWFCLILFIPFVQSSWVITDQRSSVRTHSSGPEAKHQKLVNLEVMKDSPGSAQWLQVTTNTEVQDFSIWHDYLHQIMAMFSVLWLTQRNPQG